MKIATLVLALAAYAYAMPGGWTDLEGPGYDVDNIALLSSAMVLVTRNGGNATEVLNIVLPYVLTEDLNFPKLKQIELLTAGGLTIEQSMKVLEELLPFLKKEGKTTEETTMSILLAVKQFCRKNKNGDSTCPDDEETVLPLIAMNSERGCGKLEIVSQLAELDENETCVCDEQTDLLFWVSLFNQMSSSVNMTMPDQLPSIIIMMLEDGTCNGTLKIAGGRCGCTGITTGHEATMLQYLITSPKLRKLLTPEQNKALKEAVGTPALRQSMDLQDYIFSSLAGFTSPQILSLLQNRNGDSSSLIRQMILSSIGLDSSMVHILLNGGFNDNRIALINYMTNLGGIDASIIPLLLGDVDGRDFYFSSLFNSGSIDPLMGMILLGSQQGATNEQLLQYITTAIAGAQENPRYFESLGKPYVPTLPTGIYPGSQLYFAHFESLGVNTCALHDLRNRFDCGYIGISAAECETAPYCCYNPVFLTDVEVRRSTDDAITSAIAIPWCYYNVFFVYYESYYMEVQRPGNFASPIECLPLFKYGLKLDKTLYHLFDSANPTSGIGRFINERGECGFPGMTEFHCVAVRGCCWDADSPFRVPQCYTKQGPGGFNFDINSIPLAYRPKIGTCNHNPYQIPTVYAIRTPCHYTIDFLPLGYDLLSIPNDLDCEAKLGCCYERNEEVARLYPELARCYQRHGGQNTIPFGLPGANTLIQYRAGGNNFEAMGFPPVEKPSGGDKK